ncbi:hypothetical protein [Streptomyces sp. GbtcB6]|uniref:hypothetical protein n=1 Tax=Streptomyces sp. GbtcB6 TaxID=2824751 RepID=UPI001C2F5441|nr:hypothetical protein [Streptomyces sp. GbtcB6]
MIQSNRRVPAEEQLIVIIGLGAVHVAVPDLDESMDIRGHEADHGRRAGSLASRYRCCWQRLTWRATPTQR